MNDRLYVNNMDNSINKGGARFTIEIPQAEKSL